jgi:hypothetical protein
MTTIRLIREVNNPSGRGPGNGMYALQKALRTVAPDWLKIGGELQADEIPWVWHFDDKAIAIRCEVERRPYILGPNVLFANSQMPGKSHGETFLCNAAHCCLLVTESRWYELLIDRQRGPRNVTEVALWPYPIDPMPDGPLPAEYDLLIYAKSGFDEPLPGWLVGAYPRSVVVEYGKYRRDRLIDVARKSRCCVYLSNDDRGPLALAEILLCGCPAVGVGIGAPWLNGANGVQVADMSLESLIQGIADATACDRANVRELAMLTFSPSIIADRVIETLGRIAA